MSPRTCSNLSVSNALPRAVLIASLALFSTIPAKATHFRNGNYSWRPIGGTTIEFTVQDSWRRNAYSSSFGCRTTSAPNVNVPCTGPGGFAGVGDIIVEYVGATTFIPGDGSPAIGSPAGPLLYLVTSIDPANNWLFAVALDPKSFPAVDTTISHTYPAPGNYVAFTQTCCRISSLLLGNAHINNPDGNYRIETIVNVGSGNNSPVSSLPPIVVCPQNSVCSFFIPAGDPDGDRLKWRLSTALEASGTPSFFQPGPPFAPNAASVSLDGLYTWDTTGAALGPPGSNTYYSSQVVVEDLGATGAVKSKVAVDFLIQLVPKIGIPPVFNNPPEIVCGSTRTLIAGESVNATVRASDSDPGQTVELNVVGLPPGASMTPSVPLFGNPVQSLFSWSPDTDAPASAVIIFTARDSTGQQSLCSLTVNVVPRIAEGRMTGGGSIVSATGERASHGFQLPCRPDTGANLQVNWGNGKRFHLESLNQSFCANDPAVSAGKPKTAFNLLKGAGAGRYQGLPATAEWSFVDAGEPGGEDTGRIVIKDSAGTIVLSINGSVNGGNHQAHK